MSNDIIEYEPKSFWKRPEGKTGLLTLAGLGALAFWGWGRISGFVLRTISDTFWMGIYAVGIVVLGMVVFSPKTHLLFRLASRAITGLFIEIDPIGILKDRVSQMRKRKADVDKQVNTVSQQLRGLRDNISRNKDEISKQSKEVLAAQNRASSASREEQVRMNVAAGVRTNQVSRLLKANENLEKLRVLLQNSYDALTRVETYLDGYILDSENAARTEEMQRKAVTAAVGAWRSAMRILRGNAREEEIYSRTIEFLADDASRKLGEIEDYQRRVQTFMDNIDLENASFSGDALKQLEAFEPKFLPPATIRTTLPAAKSTVEMRKAGGDGDGYGNLFKK